MPLVHLGVDDTGVTDLEPLRGMPLGNLQFNKTRVTDLSPLAGMTLTDVRLTPNTITQGMKILREMKSLTNLNSIAPLEFWEKYDGGRFGSPISPNRPVTDFEAPEFQQWVGRVAELPAEKQLEEVSKKLMELNPGFDGKLSSFQDDSRPPDIERGVVVTLKLITNQVTDISPLRALRGLKRLSCNGVGEPGVLSDLSPLRGMGLSQLFCNGTMIRDLTGLEGMPLEVLDAGVHAGFRPFAAAWDEAEVPGARSSKRTSADLAPLQGMPLEELGCDALKISDLSPLKQAKLIRAYFSRTLVSDLRVLRGMPLEAVSLTGSWVSDLSPLCETELTDLDFTPKNITKGLEAIPTDAHDQNNRCVPKPAVAR